MLVENKNNDKKPEQKQNKKRRFILHVTKCKFIKPISFFPS